MVTSNTLNFGAEQIPKFLSECDLEVIVELSAVVTGFLGHLEESLDRRSRQVRDNDNRFYHLVDAGLLHEVLRQLYAVLVGSAFLACPPFQRDFLHGLGQQGDVGETHFREFLARLGDKWIS